MNPTKPLTKSLPPVAKRASAVPLQRVRIEDAFWSPRQRNVLSTVVPYQWDALNDNIPGAEPSHTIENFRIAAGEAEGDYYGMVFQDSDLGKWLETVGFALSIEPNPELERTADEVIELLGRAQRPDGYLNTYYTVKEPGKRWTNLRDNHELYCAGHLMEAAVAYYEATGKRRFLDIMAKYADYIASVFGEGEGQIRGYDGHPEVELALVKLAAATGDAKYMELSKFFVDERGREPHFFDAEEKARLERDGVDNPRLREKRKYDYFQAHLPVRQQTTAEGHSVRAVYLYTAMADLAAAYGDKELFDICRTLWRDTTRRKMYVTGGIGSSAYEERFTVPFDLPADRAYTETCAAIGLMFWAQRMLQIEPDREYADVMELALYNGVLSGISLDGKSYFYVNPLEVWPETANFRHDMRTVKVTRQPWFGCACCPPNIARLLASLGEYVYGQDEASGDVYVHLYIGGEASLDVGGKPVKLTQRSDYPWNGDVELTVDAAEPTAFGVALRVPGWSRGFAVTVNGEPVDVAVGANGYAVVRRTWVSGDRIALSLPMPVDVVCAHPSVRDAAGKVALRRGPVVYCLEEADNGANLRDIVLPDDAKLEARFDASLLGGVCVVEGAGWRTEEGAAGDGDAPEELYTTRRFRKIPAPIRAVPYYAWSNRGPGEMTVWIRSQ